LTAAPPGSPGSPPLPWRRGSRRDSDCFLGRQATGIALKRGHPLLRIWAVTNDEGSNQIHLARKMVVYACLEKADDFSAMVNKLLIGRTNFQ
jgi:hypothetical protein